MIKFGFKYLFFTITQLIGVLIWSELKWFLSMREGIYGTKPFTNISYIYFVLIGIQVLISIIIIMGFKEKQE